MNKEKKEDLKKADEKTGYGLHDQMGKEIELSLKDEKNTSYYGILRSLDDLGVVIEWEDEKSKLFQFFQWGDIKHIWWNKIK